MCKFVIIFSEIYCLLLDTSLVGMCVIFCKCISMCCCVPALVLCVCVCLCFGVGLEAREPAIKKRTGTSKGLEAQTQHTCWQSIGKPGEVKSESDPEKKRGSRDERGKKEEGRVSAMWDRRGVPEGRGRAQTQAAHIHPPQPSVWFRLVGGSMCEYMCCNVCVCVCVLR